ncbi:MAG TPA: hypothetical protein PKE45_17655, partial [Caldilineaceae bacterium]|nr:hypothetical protein [Caldilineaceae bacterium]
QQDMSLATLMQYEAVQLFIERAQAVLTAFTVDDADALAVAEICVRLDGLPLAIELAAARVKFYSPQVLLKKLHGPVGPASLDLLQHGARDLPERHKTLRQTIAWSYELLSAAEQALFRKLCVFVGGFPLEAAEALCTADGMLAFDVLEGIESLVNKSLVNQREQPDGEPRFTLLETIREFGLELLQANHELAAVQRAHAEYYTASTLALLADTLGPRRAAIFDQLEEEHDNIRATLNWAVMAQAWPLAIRLVGPLRDLWYYRGHYREGQECVERVLALAGEVQPSLELAEAIYCAGFLAHAHSDFRTARLRFAHCLQMSRQHGYLWGQSYAAALLANVAFEQGCYAEASSLLEEGLYAGEQLGTVLWHRGVMLARKANHALLLGHFAEAQSLCDQALAIHQGIGEKWAIAQVYDFRSYLAYYQGDYSAARALRDQSDSYNREVNDPRTAAHGFDLRGLVAIEQGELDAAQQLLMEALKVRRKLGNRKDLALSFQNLAQLAATQGQPVRALQLAGAAAALCATIGMVLPPMPRKRLDSTVYAAQQALSPEAATAAWAAGERMTLNGAVDYALAQPESLDP